MFGFKVNTFASPGISVEEAKYAKVCSNCKTTEKGITGPNW